MLTALAFIWLGMKGKHILSQGDVPMCSKANSSRWGQSQANHFEKPFQSVMCPNYFVRDDVSGKNMRLELLLVRLMLTCDYESAREA